jgi:DNA-binding NtrC family response regulator
MGGTRARRLAVVRAFHHRSPLAGEPLVALDCAKDEPRLARTLERWLLASSSPSADGNELKEPIGVLYLDSIAELSPATQRLLLMFAHRLQGGQSDTRPPGPARLMAGDRTNLIRAAEAGRFSRALVDHLDKIRVELGQRRSLGAA